VEIPETRHAMEGEGEGGLGSGPPPFDGVRIALSPLLSKEEAGAGATPSLTTCS